MDCAPTQEDQGRNELDNKGNNKYLSPCKISGEQTEGQEVVSGKWPSNSRQIEGKINTINKE